MIRRHIMPGCWLDRELPDAVSWLPAGSFLRCSMDWRGNCKESATGLLDDVHLPGGRPHDLSYVRSIIRSNRYSLLA